MPNRTDRSTKHNFVSHSQDPDLICMGYGHRQAANYAVFTNPSDSNQSTHCANPATDPVLPTVPGKACPLCLPASKSAGSVACRGTQYK
jgi:hypothetical protein